jgi:hypothetical protein
MTKSPPAPLVIPKKGEAAPAVASLEARHEQHHSPAVTEQQQQQPAPSRLMSRIQATIAVTVRLDEARYERMKSWGTSRRVTNQEVIVAALDRFFGLSDEEREQEILRVRQRS